jgi:hypothetical protein
LVDPLSVTHHAPLSSQISQCRRLAYLPLTTISLPRCPLHSDGPVRRTSA